MKKILIALLIIVFLPSYSHAHILSGETGFMAGLLHPVLGFDHFLAMLSVGILSTQMGGRAIWAVPLAFVTVMTIGAILGFQSIALPGVEYGIALSVLVLGISIAMENKMPTLWAMVFVGFFAIFHGHAHGNEMPEIAKPLVYAIGFVSGTAGIHLAGVIMGIIFQKTARGTEILRYIGAGISGVGVHILYIIMKYKF